MKTEFKDMQTQRIYIGNFVARHYKDKKECVVCGSDSEISIIHNPDDAYSISFICKNCRMKLNRQDLLNLPKINILEHIDLNRKFSHSSNLVLDSRIKFILEHALQTEKSLMEYLRENKLSYSKYKKAIALYEKDVKPIKNELRKHFNSLRAQKVVKMRSQN